ncbi:MAG: rod shape-determining protein [Lachnospiraceae bacterium]
MGTNVYGIDLGTCNIKIYAKGEDGVMIQKNMIAIENKKNLFAYGDSAYEMYEKAPDNIQISFPLNNGVIADIKDMEVLIKYFVTDLMKGKVVPADYYIAVPTDVTEVEKRAFYDLVKNANVKPKNVYIVEKPIADGLGFGIDVKNSSGTMVVNVGYHTTEISILSLGGIVLSKLIKNGGFKFDECIRSMVRKEFNLLIGNKSAEKIKIALNELDVNGEDAIVFGRDVVTGLPMERRIPVVKVQECLLESFTTIIDYVKSILEKTPPELAVDIYKNGIYLTGGASQIDLFQKCLAHSTSLKVQTMQEPVASVALGLSKIINEDYFKTVASSVEGINK